jgi:hypothetical protein
MTQHDAHCQVTLPVPDLDVPIAYFVRVAQTYSPLRLCKPRELGLMEPTGHFRTFLEGFEEDLTAWHLLSSASSLQTSPVAKSGRAALLVRLPADEHAVTITTTLLRGWQLKAHGALGLRLWLRSESGQARARLSLFENAFTPCQCIQTWSELTSFGPTWQKVDLYFTELPSLDLADVDLFTIELIGQGPCGFLVDDVEVLARD